MRLRFWGTRGSVPAPEASHMGFGGNTSCLEVRVAGADPIVCDAGTGLRRLGETLLAAAEERGRAVRLTLLLSHLHWDHIQGLPFFLPLYRPESEITILVPAGALVRRRRALRIEFAAPFFPVPWRRLPARIAFVSVPAAGLVHQGVRYRCCRLYHPQGAHAFRLEAEGRMLVYALDHEHGNAAADGALTAFASRADLLVGDAQYTPEEYAARRGWGHSTWPALTALARRARARRLIVSHHDPRHNDATLAALERAAQAAFSPCAFAREGRAIEL